MSYLIEKTPRSYGKSSTSIYETNYVKINNTKQYILIRSQDIRNPVLLLIHGGPGFTETSLFRYYNADLEKKYTVVYWDQRQCGKSFQFMKRQSILHIDFFVEDLICVAEYLIRKFDKKKITLLAHSWGTLISLIAVQKKPEIFNAYIGCGQVSSMPNSELSSYNFTLRKANEDKNSDAIKALQNIREPEDGVYSCGYRGTQIQRKWLNFYNGAFYQPSTIKQLQKVLFNTSEYNIFSTLKVLISMNDKARNEMTYKEFLRFDLMAQYEKYEIPIYFLLGKHDNQISSKIAEEYFNKITAPYKHLEWFENSGHAPCFEEPDKFNDFVCSIKG